MTEKLNFTTDAGLIDRLGRELVGRQETALIELVKNSFDADARSVTVTLETDALTIEDNGTGMTRDEIVAGFLRLASTLKVQEPTSRLFKRQRAGRKGIGRFATQRLGEALTLKTWVNDNEPGIQLRVDWQKFASGCDLNDVPVYLSIEPPSAPGTKIRIEKLRDNWSDAQIRRCWRGLLALQQPFPVAPIDRRPDADPGFEVRFIRESGLFSDPELVVDFRSEMLDHGHAIIELRVDGNGIAEWRVTQSQFGADRGWTRIHHEHRDSACPPTYTFLRNIAMKAYYFILLPDLLPKFAFSRVRDALRQEGGVRLYRNGFRVVPYGEPGDDWLHLDMLYSQRGQVLAPVANRNFFGVIEVYDPEGRQFEEHTSREGLIETDSFRELTGLATAVLATAVNRIAEDRDRKKSAGGSTQRKAEETMDLLRAAVQSVQQAEEALPIDRASGEGSSDENGEVNPNTTEKREETRSAQGESTAQLLKKSIALLEQQQAELADEAALLRLLATLGLTTTEFSHETGMTFEALRMDLAAVFETALQARSGDDAFTEQAERANSMLNRLDALTAYLNELASARSVRQLSAISVSKAISAFENGVRKLAEKAGVTLVVDTPEYDPLYTMPMHSAEIASILLNFFSNSLKALRRTEGRRGIEVKAERENDHEIVIRFSDSGDGIPEKNRERIFDLFFTTSVAAPATANTAEQFSGTGLGLWIVSQIISKAGGNIEAVDPPTGFSTCLEVRLPAEEEK